MAKLDPKLLKKVVQSELIRAAQAVGVKNAEKISKESLIPAFMKKVESLTDEAVKQAEKIVIDTYNFLVKLFDLEDKPEGGDEAGETKKVEKGKEEVKKVAKPKKEKKVKKEREGAGAPRIKVICSIIKSKKKGKWKEIGELANKIYIEKGGGDSMRHTLWMTGMILGTLLEMGYMKKEGTEYSLIK